MVDAKLKNWDDKQQRRGATFFQSSKWAEFQRSQSLGCELLEGTGWSCLVIIKRNRFGKYLFAPYGPTLRSPDHIADSIISLTKLARELNADWIKLEPMLENGDMADITMFLKKHGAVRAVHDNEPAMTRVLDLSIKPEALLASVSQSTRSLIRKNKREGTLRFKTSVTPADMAGFAAMLDTVADRKGIGFFPAKYYIKQAEILMPAKMMYLEQAFFGNKLVGGAVMHDYGQVGSYTYAASLPDARNLSVSALLLWQAIANARSRGIKTMDLYGTAPEGALPSHPWYGFSTYKKKFGGRIVELSGTWDIPLTSKYRIYRSAQTVYRKIRRR